jgi:hypothetical protein
MSIDPTFDNDVVNEGATAFAERTRPSFQGR